MNNRAVLLINLGSPDSPSVSDVRKYLGEFLMDGRVLDAPFPIRWCIVNLAILPSRPKHSAEAYKQIWTAEGSPLVATSRRVQAKLESRVGITVELAMRYQNPSVEDAICKLHAEGIEHVLLIPMFPHFAMSSYETAVERVKKMITRISPGMSLTVVPPYFDRPDYIKALVGSAADYLAQPYDHLLFSFHGIPERHVKKSDPTGCHCLGAANCCSTPSPAHETCYRAQCFRTAQAFARQAGIAAGKYSISFQSRLGRDPWLKPYTDDLLESLPKKGAKNLLVICPAFVSDCLETLEEIGLRGRQSFLQAGGEKFTLIPCLNEHPLWLATLEKMVADWKETPFAPKYDQLVTSAS